MPKSSSEKLDTDFFQCVHGCNGVFDIFQQQAFRQFQLEQLWIDGMALHGSLHLSHEISLAELLGTHVHRQNKVAG